MLSGFTAWHLVVLLALIVPLVLWIVALVQLARSKAPGTTVLLWILVISVFPLLGPILWFVLGSRTAEPRRSQ